MPHDSNQQAGANLRGSEDFERAAREYKQIAEGVNDTLPLEGLSPLKAYVEGRLRILLRFKAEVLDLNHSLLLHIGADANEREVVKSRDATVRSRSGESVERDASHRRDENAVLVGPIELVDAVKPFALPAVKRLYFLDDDIPNPRAGAMSVTYMSLNKTRHRLPRVSQWEACLPVNRMAIGFDQDAICVVERRSEVMDRISDHCRRMGREVAPKGDIPITPFVLLCLGENKISVFSNEHPENTFKLVDVMFGPFGL